MIVNGCGFLTEFMSARVVLESVFVSTMRPFSRLCLRLLASNSAYFAIQALRALTCVMDKVSISPMNNDLLSDLLAAVEQQMVSPQTKYVGKTYERLCGIGLSSDEAKEQIAMCLGDVMDEMMRGRGAFDEKAYRESLDGLPLEEE
jgi:hypothetical protein